MEVVWNVIPAESGECRVWGVGDVNRCKIPLEAEQGTHMPRGLVGNKMKNLVLVLLRKGKSSRK